MRRLRVVVGLTCLLALPGVALASAPTSPSLTLDQPSPVFGQDITLTGVYAKVYHGRQPQLPNQPGVQLDCSDPGTGALLYQQIDQTNNHQGLGGGWTSSTYAFTLSGPSWAAGAASCSAVLYYFDASIVLHEMAFAYFTVSP